MLRPDSGARHEQRPQAAGTPRAELPGAALRPPEGPPRPPLPTAPLPFPSLRRALRPVSRPAASRLPSSRPLSPSHLRGRGSGPPPPRGFLPPAEQEGPKAPRGPAGRHNSAVRARCPGGAPVGRPYPQGASGGGREGERGGGRSAGERKSRLWILVEAEPKAACCAPSSGNFPPEGWYRRRAWRRSRCLSACGSSRLSSEGNLENTTYICAFT